MTFATSSGFWSIMIELSDFLIFIITIIGWGRTWLSPSEKNMFLIDPANNYDAFHNYNRYQDDCMYILMMQHMNTHWLDTCLVIEYRIIIPEFVFLELAEDKLIFIQVSSQFTFSCLMSWSQQKNIIRSFILGVRFPY